MALTFIPAIEYLPKDVLHTSAPKYLISNEVGQLARNESGAVLASRSKLGHAAAIYIGSRQNDERHLVVRRLGRLSVDTTYLAEQRMRPMPS